MNKSVESISLEKAKLYDGPEEGFYTSSFEVQRENMPLMKFTTSKFINNSFEELSNLVGENIFNQIVREGGFKFVDFSPPFYKGTYNLEMNFLMQDNYVVVLANGETQPMRFKIYVEGVWRIT